MQSWWKGKKMGTEMKKEGKERYYFDIRGRKDILVLKFHLWGHMRLHDRRCANRRLYLYNIVNLEHQNDTF